MEEASLVCQFCWQGAEVEAVSGRLYAETAESGNFVSAHLRCMQYASGLTQYTYNKFGGFDIHEVEKEIARGNKLRCFICRNMKGRKTKGACCGCAVRSCRKTFHFTCAHFAPTAITKRLVSSSKTDLSNKCIFYRVFCSSAHELEFRKNLKEDLIRKKKSSSSVKLEDSAKHLEIEDHESLNSQLGDGQHSNETSSVPNGNSAAAELSTLGTSFPPSLSDHLLNNSIEEDNDEIMSTENSDHGEMLESDSDEVRASPVNCSDQLKGSRKPVMKKIAQVKNQASEPLLSRLHDVLKNWHHTHGKERSPSSIKEAAPVEGQAQNAFLVEQGDSELVSAPTKDSTENESPNVPQKTPLKMRQAELTNGFISVQSKNSVTDHPKPLSLENFQLSLSKVAQLSQAQLSHPDILSQTGSLSCSVSKNPDPCAVENDSQVSRCNNHLSITSPRRTQHSRLRAGKTQLTLNKSKQVLLSRTHRSFRNVPNQQTRSQQMERSRAKNGHVKIADQNPPKLGRLCRNKRKVSDKSDSVDRAESSCEVLDADVKKSPRKKRNMSETCITSGEATLIEDIKKPEDGYVNYPFEDVVIVIPNDMDVFEYTGANVIELTSEILKIEADRVFVWQKLTKRSLPPDLIIFFMLELVRELQNGNDLAVMDLLFDRDVLTSQANNYLVTQSVVFQSVSDETAQKNILAGIWNGLSASVTKLPMLKLINLEEHDLTALAIDMRDFKLATEVMAYMRAYSDLFWWSVDTEAIPLDVSPRYYSEAVQTEAMVVKKWLTKVNPITQITVLPAEEVFWGKETLTNKHYFSLVEDLRKEIRAPELMECAAGTSLHAVVPLLVFQPLDFLLVNFLEYFRKACTNFFQKSCLINVLALVPLSNLFSNTWESVSSLLDDEGEEGKYTISISSAFCPKDNPTTMVLLEIMRKQQPLSNV